MRQSKPRPRAYAHPVPPAETAARIARSIREHQALGIARRPTDYTADTGTVLLVSQQLAQEAPHAV